MYRGTNDREEEVGLGWGGLVPTAEERRAEKREESAQHSLQQLKAEIAALVREFDSGYGTVRGENVPLLLRAMRQLSAV
jgi:hypothetical protein